MNEREWIADYERKQGAALGQAGYKLPSQDELLAEHREHDRKKKKEIEARQRADA